MPRRSRHITENRVVSEIIPDPVAHAPVEPSPYHFSDERLRRGFKKISDDLSRMILEVRIGPSGGGPLMSYSEIARDLFLITGERLSVQDVKQLEAAAVRIVSGS